MEGLGLFATDFISKGSDLGITHFICPDNISYPWDKIIRTPLGGFTNHSDDANCKKSEKHYFGGQIKTFNLYTLRDIEIGKELTLKYTLYKL